MESTSFLYILTIMYPGVQMTKDPLQSMCQQNTGYGQKKLYQNKFNYEHEMIKKKNKACEMHGNCEAYYKIQNMSI